MSRLSIASRSLAQGSVQAIDRFENPFVTKIIFAIEREQRLQEYESDFIEAADCVEGVSALSKTAGMEKGEFCGAQAIQDHLLPQHDRIDFNAALELLEQMLRIEQR